MKDLSTKYLGLELQSPLIVGSCGLTKTVESIKLLAENKAGAVVLKSLFEEQIEAELSQNLESYQADYPDAFDYIRSYTRENALSEYLDLIADAKKAVDIPIIASINCISGSEWVAFAKSLEKAGADAIELNVSLLPSDPRMNSQESERHYFDIVEKVSTIISIPLSLKMSSYSSALANLITRLSWTNKVAGFVLFNRYYRPDVDIQKMKVTKADIFSTPSEMTESLRWIALLSGQVERDFAASTGVHDSEGLIKHLLVGAAAAQVVTAVYKNGPGYISTMLQGLENWMDEKGFDRLADFRGFLSYRNAENPAAFERIQFMKQFGGIA
ncbi:MAG: dihydroorotate dehydrogenase-like protein [Desulfobulbaceae bacterium]|jgi:dihydroorotate dehydrogenase (fumarate)|nr:dihydroorotate dehydrogenase-like protein [Desulfobulbaceae bacterium]